MANNERTTIQTDAAPAAIGAYSQAVHVGEMVYVSGQIPLDPVTMELVSGGFKAQARQVLANLSAVAGAAGGSLENAVKLTVYLTDLGHFSALNEVFSELLVPPFPARAAIEVSALPKGAEIEIDAVLWMA